MVQDIKAEDGLGIATNITELTSTNKIYSRFAQAKSAIQGIEAIDYFFAKEMTAALIIPQGKAISAECEQQLFHVFLALSASLRAGHSCLSLTDIADVHWGKGYALSDNQILEPSSQAEFGLEHSGLSHAGFVFASLVQLQAMLAALTIKFSDQHLLVFENDKLYLRRYYQFEYDLGRAINSRLLQPCLYDYEHIRQCISALFPDDAAMIFSSEVDWQKIAVANAINKNFSVIAGGPGTGKTYTVTKLLAALLMLAHADADNSKLNVDQCDESQLNIALVAPTGKAAQRLSESIVDAISGFKGLIDKNILAKVSTQAQTIHRLLGVIPNSPNFRHHEGNRLAYDVVLIDEVSMVDLPLMTRIFRALKDSAKVILLGDADQLPSVAAGSVLADIAPRPHGGYSITNQDYLSQVCQLSAAQVEHSFSAELQVTATTQSLSQSHDLDYLSFLVKSRRFDGKGGIGLIANEVINGQAKASWQRLMNTRTQESSQLSMGGGELSAWLQPLVKQYYQPIAACVEVSDAFTLLAKFRVLCATRQGDFGVERINEVIKSYLGKSQVPYQQGLHNQQKQSLYHGQPIMINENDYRLGLYNGDIGVIWSIVDQDGNTHLMACFESDVEGPKIRQILPSRLPKFETVYAMTIHKTQGSEFAHVAMVLSASESESSAKQQTGSKLLTRELLYTGITRAKKHLTICANQGVWQQGVIGQVKRNSGLQLY